MTQAFTGLFDYLGDVERQETLEELFEERSRLNEREIDNRHQLQSTYVDIARQQLNRNRINFGSIQELRSRLVDNAQTNTVAREETLRLQLRSQERQQLANINSNTLLGLRDREIKENTIGFLLGRTNTFETAGRDVTETIAGNLRALSSNTAIRGETLENADTTRATLNAGTALDLATGVG